MINLTEFARDPLTVERSVDITQLTINYLANQYGTVIISVTIMWMTAQFILNKFGEDLEKYPRIERTIDSIRDYFPLLIAILSLYAIRKISGVYTGCG